MRPEVLKYFAIELERAGEPFAEGIGVKCDELLREGDGILGRAVSAVDLYGMQSAGILSSLAGAFGQPPLFALTAKGVAMARRIHLTAEARDAARAIVEARIGKRHLETESAVGRVKAEMGARGMFHSSLTVTRIREIVVKELEDRLAIVVSVWAGIARRWGFELGRDWKEMVQDALERAIAGSGHLANTYRYPVPGFEVHGQPWEQRCAAALQAAEAEVAAAIHLEPEGGAVLMTDELNIQHITGPVGTAIAGGKGHQVSVHQETGPVDYAAGVPHIEALVKVLEEARVAGDGRAVEPLEAAALALGEAKKPTPNRVTLGGLVAGLNHAVAAVNGWPGALDALRAAAAAWGVDLP